MFQPGKKAMALGSAAGLAVALATSPPAQAQFMTGPSPSWGDSNREPLSDAFVDV